MGELEFDESFGYTPLLGIGGSEKIENLEKVKTKEHIEIITQMVGRIESHHKGGEFIMKNQLIEQLKNVLPKGIQIPKEIEMLYQFIEDNELYKDRNGYRYGMLYSEDKLKASMIEVEREDGITEYQREGGTDITFYPGGTENLKYWFGQEYEELEQRLCVFAQSGADGSECAFWLNDSGDLKIVHMGSGSGSTLTCVLADNVVDFLRLIAIGYDEICWDEDFKYPPNENPSADVIVKPNIEFQNWVKQTFGVEIPRTALEIIKYPACMDDENSEDEFFNWIKKYD